MDFQLPHDDGSYSKFALTGWKNGFETVVTSVIYNVKTNGTNYSRKMLLINGFLFHWS